jgi:hypothetical protein
MNECENTNTIMFVPEGKDFRLVRIDEAGEKTDIVLSVMNLVALQRSLQMQLRDILSRMPGNQSGVSPVAVASLKQAVVNHDLTASSVLLTMIDFLGAELRYGMTPDQARDIADTMRRRADLVESQSGSLKKQ